MITITKGVSVGIYDNCEYIARIYADKIIVTTPYVKWKGNTGGYAELKQEIRDKKVVDAVLTEVKNHCEDSVWGHIGRYLQDGYLARQAA